MNSFMDSPGVNGAHSLGCDVVVVAVVSGCEWHTLVRV